MKKACQIALTLALFVGLILPAKAQTENGDFDVLLRGVKAATVSFSAQQNGAAYSVTGRIQTTGLAGVLKQLRYEGATRGTFANGRYRPVSYVDSTDTGRRQSNAKLLYDDGLPQVADYFPVDDTGADIVDPTTMAETVDPLTAFFASVRAVDAGSACNLTLNLFDGKRASRLQVGPPATTDGKVTCDGTYSRLQGFTPSEMAKHSRFPFTLTYAPTPSGQMQVVEVITESTYGKVTLKRR